MKPELEIELKAVRLIQRRGLPVIPATIHIPEAQPGSFRPMTLEETRQAGADAARHLRRALLGKHPVICLLFVLFASFCSLRAATVTGLVQQITLNWSTNTTIIFSNISTPSITGGGALVTSQPKPSYTTTAGWFSNYLTFGTYKVFVGPSPRDIVTVQIPDDTGTYDLWSLRTNSLSTSSNAPTIVRGVAQGTNGILTVTNSGVVTVHFTGSTGGGGSGDVTTAQLNTASNALSSLMSQLDTTTSNGLYSLISGGGITAGVATNIAQYFATNSAIITSNTLWSAIGAAGTNPVVLSAGNLITTNKLAVGTNAATATVEVQGTVKSSGTIATDGHITATSGSATIAAGGAYRFNGRSAITSNGDGILRLFNNALSSFSFLNFGLQKGISNAADGFRFTDGTAQNLTNLAARNLLLTQPTASSIAAIDPDGWLTNATAGSGLSYSGTTLSLDWPTVGSVTNEIYHPSITRLDFQRRDPSNGITALTDESGLAYRLIGNTDQAQITNGAFKLNFKAIPTNGAAAVYIVGTNQQRLTALGMKYAVTNDTGSATTPFTVLIVQSNSLESAGTMQLGAGFHIPISNAGVDVQLYTNGVASAISLGTIPFRNYFTDGYLRSLAVVFNGDNTITVQGDGIYGTVTNARVEAVRGAEGNTGHFTFEQYAVGTNITYQPLWASLWTANAAAWNQLKAAQDQSVNLDGQMFTRVSSNAFAHIGDQSVPVSAYQWWVSNTSKAMLLDSNGYLAIARSAKPDSAIRAPLSIYSPPGSSGGQVDLSSTADSQNVGLRFTRDHANKFFVGLLGNTSDLSIYSDNGGGLLSRWYDASGALYNVGTLTNGGGVYAQTGVAIGTNNLGPSALDVHGGIRLHRPPASSLLMLNGSQDLTNVTIGSGLSLAGTTLSATGGGGGGGGTFTNFQFTIDLDGFGGPISTGLVSYVRIPSDCTITGWDIISANGVTGSLVMDVWKDTYANFPPTSTDSIAGSEKPTLSSATKNQDAALTTWTTTACTKGEYLGFHVDSASTLTRASVFIYYTVP
jgi:hypothetical protein